MYSEILRSASDLTRRIARRNAIEVIEIYLGRGARAELILRHLT